jgi:hypothetical protein
MLMQMIKLSPRAMLQTNLIFGAFVAVTNGGALVLTISGGRSHIHGQLGEAALWAAAGFALLSLSVIGMRRPQSINAVVETQTLVAFALVGALAAWGLTIALGTYRAEGTLAWSAGFLSALGFYCYVLYSSVQAIRGWGRGLRPFAIAFVIACIGIDVAAFSAVMKA